MTKTDTPRHPSHYLYAVTKREDAEKAHWALIRAAWPNGEGFSLKLELIPVNGADIVMCEPKAEEQPQ